MGAQKGLGVTHGKLMLIFPTWARSCGAAVVLVEQSTNIIKVRQGRDWERILAAFCEQGFVVKTLILDVRHYGLP